MAKAAVRTKAQSLVMFHEGENYMNGIDGNIIKSAVALLSSVILSNPINVALI